MQNNIAQFNNQTNFYEMNSKGTILKNNTFSNYDDFKTTNSLGSNLFSSTNIIVISTTLCITLLFMIYSIRFNLLLKHEEDESLKTEKKLPNRIVKKFKSRKNQNKISKETLDILMEIIEETRLE